MSSVNVQQLRIYAIVFEYELNSSDLMVLKTRLHTFLTTAALQAYQIDGQRQYIGYPDGYPTKHTNLFITLWTQHLAQIIKFVLLGLFRPLQCLNPLHYLSFWRLLLAHT